MKNENARFLSMIKWLGGVTAGMVFFAVCIAAHADDQIIDLKGIWSGYVIRHVTQNGFVPFYSGMRLLIEEQNGTQFKGYLVNDLGRDETRAQFTGAMDLKNEYLYLRFTSGDVSIGQIATENRLILIIADSDKDIVTVFKLRKAPAP
jgi:hypothetical protein